MARSIRTVVKALFGREQKAQREEYNKLVDEVDELRTNFADLLAKLDADGGTADTDYASTLDTAAAQAKKIAVE